MLTGASRKFFGIVVGVFVGLVLHGGAQWWGQTAFAQGAGGTSYTASTKRTTFFESPPACGPIGSSRVVTNPTLRITNSIGPKCLGVDEISVPNPNPACGGFPADPVLDPSFGTTFLVAAGNINIDATTSIDTYQCVADVPAMPWTFLTGLGGLLLCLGVWMMSRRTAGGAGPGATA